MCTFFLFSAPPNNYVCKYVHTRTKPALTSQNKYETPPPVHDLLAHMTFTLFAKTRFPVYSLIGESPR